MVSSGNCALLGALLVLGACNRTDVQDLSTDLEQARMMDAIEDLIALGDLADARQALLEALDRGLENPRAEHLAGRLAEAAGDHRAATERYARAVATSPGWLEPRVALADAYRRSGRPESADSVFAEIDRLHPEHPVGPYGRGVIARQRERFNEADAFLDEALSRDPSFAPALRLRAYSAEQAGDLERQRALLLRYIQVHPDDPRAHFDLGANCEAKGQLEDAKHAFTRSWRLRPSRDTALRLAELASRQGQTQTAQEWRQRAE